MNTSHGGRTAVLSTDQLATLRAHGQERTAAVGDVLYRVGDRTYPFIAILEGEAAIVDSAGDEIARPGPSGFPGELNLLSGDGQLSDLLLATFIARRESLQRVQGIGLEIVGPHSSEATLRMVEFTR